jgi:lipoprotein-anchoring transpeptidase ErfK/SrfK
MEKLIAYFISTMMAVSGLDVASSKLINEVPTNEIVEEVTQEEVQVPAVNEITPPEPTLAPVTTKIPYYIKVNKKENVVNVYTVDSEGAYSVPFKAMLCSTGTSTPKTGSKYKITSYRTLWNKLKGNVYGQYAVQITGNILFHSVPYTKRDNTSLEYWEYDKLGTKASLGCIRLAVEDAKWIYDNIVPGTWVEFYEDDNPGPFGKPERMKISEDIERRNWDPTDPNENNPWRQ